MGGRKVKSTKAMRRGLALEDSVIRKVEKMRRITVKKAGLQLLPCWPIFGASPDAINDDLVLEVKCSISELSRKRYFTDGGKPAPKFLGQMQLQMLMTGRKLCLYCVADPDFEKNGKVHVTEVPYDDLFTSTLLENAEKFWKKAIFPKIFATVV